MPQPLDFLRRRVRFVALLVLAAMLAGVGQLGLGALQVTAWSAMMVGYTQQTGSVQEALSMTFDGAHPCSMCQEVKELASGQQQEKNQAEREQLRMPLALPAENTIVVSRPSGVELTAESRVLDSRDTLPATPPPRV